MRPKEHTRTRTRTRTQGTGMPTLDVAGQARDCIVAARQLDQIQRA